MSTTERFGEFGVLRTNGWSRGHILALVTLESAYLGLLAGLAGCVLAWSGAAVVATSSSPGGFHLGMLSLALGDGHRHFGRHRHPGRALSRLAGRPTWPRWRRSGSAPDEPSRPGAKGRINCGRARVPNNTTEPNERPSSDGPDDGAMWNRNRWNTEVPDGRRADRVRVTPHRLAPGREPEGSADDRREERVQVVPERQSAGRGLAGDQLPDRSGPVRVHRRAERLGQELVAVSPRCPRPADFGRDPGRRVRTSRRCPSRGRTPTAATQIGFIFQSFNLISNLTALENVLVPFLPRGVSADQRRRARRAL